MKILYPWSRRGFLAGAAVLLSACTSDLVNPALPPPNSTLAFRDGYIQGCPSGFADGRRDPYSSSYWKDVKRYDTDAEYKKGWDQGHGACYEEQLRNPWVGGPDGPSR